MSASSALDTVIMIKTKGFTLLEILVAVFIFAFVSLIIASMLHYFLLWQGRLDQHSRRYDELQFTTLILAQDLQQTIDRPVMNEEGQVENAFLGDKNKMTFTQSGLSNPL